MVTPAAVASSAMAEVSMAEVTGRPEPLSGAWTRTSCSRHWPWCSSRGTSTRVSPAVASTSSAAASTRTSPRVSPVMPTFANPMTSPPGLSSSSTGLRFARGGPMRTLTTMSRSRTLRR